MGTMVPWTGEEIRILAEMRGKRIAFPTIVPNDYEGTALDWAQMQCADKGLKFVAIAKKGERFHAEV